MCEIKIFTLYPNFFPGPLNEGLYGKAKEKNIWKLKVIDIRNSAEDRHKTVDDKPFGGGAGMIMMAETLQKSLDYVKETQSKN